MWLPWFFSCNCGTQHAPGPRGHPRGLQGECLSISTHTDRAFLQTVPSKRNFISHCWHFCVCINFHILWAVVIAERSHTLCDSGCHRIYLEGTCTHVKKQKQKKKPYYEVCQIPYFFVQKSPDFLPLDHTAFGEQLPALMSARAPPPSVAATTVVAAAMCGFW